MITLFQKKYTIYFFIIIASIGVYFDSLSSEDVIGYGYHCVVPEDKISDFDVKVNGRKDTVALLITHGRGVIPHIISTHFKIDKPLLPFLLERFDGSDVSDEDIINIFQGYDKYNMCEELSDKIGEVGSTASVVIITKDGEVIVIGLGGDTVVFSESGKLLVEPSEGLNKTFGYFDEKFKESVDKTFEESVGEEDFYFNATPSIERYSLDELGEHLVLATDGVVNDSNTPDEVAEQMNSLINQGLSLREVAAHLVLGAAKKDRCDYSDVVPEEISDFIISLKNGDNASFDELKRVREQLDKICDKLTQDIPFRSLLNRNFLCKNAYHLLFTSRNKCLMMVNLLKAHQILNNQNV